MDRIFDDYLQISQLVRAKCIDDEIKPFLEKFPLATIVNIGAGFDTTFDRVDNGKVTWYDLDYPEVIRLRRQYIPETPRSRCLARSVLDFSWFEDIGDCQNGLMLVACGVLFFLDERQAKTLFLELAGRFPESEIAFDTMSGLFLKIANWTVLGRSGMGSQAVMRWAVRSAREIAKWDDRIRVIDEYPMYSHVALNPSCDKATRFRMKIANWTRGINIFHLKFG
jgi:O-methyltransferase involved in polyketide biosynthesis